MKKIAPSRWKTVKLGDIVSFKTGKLDSNAATVNGAYPFFTCAQETYRTDTCAYDCECVLLAGNNAAGVYPLKYFKGKFDAYQRTYIIRAIDDSELANRFLYFALRPMLEHLKSISTGAATKFLTLGLLKGLAIELPPLETQHKIASILSAYDDLIENNNRRIKILEEMAQTIYREWFVNFRFPGHEKVKLVDSSLGMIPEGWEVTKLGDIAKEVRRSVDPEKLDPETPYVGLEHIPRKSITLADWGVAKDIQSTKLLFEKGEILFGKIRPYFHKVSVAPINGICSSDAIVISAKETGHRQIVLGCVSSVEFVSHATQTSQGTKMPRANWKVLVQYPLMIPPKQILGQFNAFMDNVVNHTRNLMFKNRNLRQTRDLFLPKLISGEIDVSEMDIEIRESAA
jgi:type I restriction enzyme S subunit